MSKKSNLWKSTEPEFIDGYYEYTLYNSWTRVKCKSKKSADELKGEINRSIQRLNRAK